MRRSQPSPLRTSSRLANSGRVLHHRLTLSLFAAALISSLTLSASTAHAASCTGANLLPALASVPTAKAATLCLLNNERSARGLLPLSADPTLETAADDYAQAMVKGRFFGHVSPGGQTITERLASYVGSGTDWATGENLAWGVNALATPASVVKGWMASDGHRENILSADFADAGVGIVGGSPSGGLPAVSATYVTAFGSHSSDSAGSSPIRASASSVAPVPAGTAKKRISAKKRAQISKRCHRIARRVKGSKKTRTRRYDRCMRNELRIAAR